MYKYFYPKQSQCSKVNYRWFYIWFEREVCLVDYVFMGDWAVLPSQSNAMGVIERMHKTFSCNFSPLKLNFPASLLRQLVICFMLFSDYYLELLFQRAPLLCPLQNDSLAHFAYTCTWSLSRAAFVNNPTPMSSVEQEETQMIMK